jgi:hypothetical protein
MTIKKNGTSDKKGKKKPAAAPAVETVAPPTRNGNQKAAADETITVELRARVRGDVFIRLRVLHPAYSAEKIAKLLNEGNAQWDVGDSARYHRIEKGGKFIAEIEYADEDTYWERYEVE